MSEGNEPIDEHAEFLYAEAERRNAEILAAEPSVETETRGHDGLLRPGPAVDVEGCPYNECQIRRQCTRRCGRSSAPSGVAAIFGALPELPDAPPMPPSDITRGQEEQAHDNENSMTARVYVDGAVWEGMKADRERLESQLKAETDEHIACAEELRRTNAEVDGLRQQVEIRTERANRMTRQIDEQGAEIERLTKERDEAVAACSRLADVEWRIDRVDQLVEQQAAGIRLVVLDQQRAARAKAETLARWKRRASKAEQRIAALEQERDGLTLRLGERVKGQVAGGNYAKAARQMYANARRAAPRKVTRAKGGR